MQCLFKSGFLSRCANNFKNNHLRFQNSHGVDLWTFTRESFGRADAGQYIPALPGLGKAFRKGLVLSCLFNCLAESILQIFNVLNSLFSKLLQLISLESGFSSKVPFSMCALKLKQVTALTLFLHVTKKIFWKVNNPINKQLFYLLYMLLYVYVK